MMTRIEDLLSCFFPDTDEDDELNEGEPYLERYKTGMGQDLWVHGPLRCKGNHCVIHNPSDHHMKDLPTFWRDDREIMERICDHGIGHPDPDEINDPLGIHGCDGCCVIKKDVVTEKQ